MGGLLVLLIALIATLILAAQDERVLKVINGYDDKEVTVLWDGDDGKEYFMFDLPPKETAVMNSFLGHRFYVKEKATGKLLPDRFSIHPDQDEVYLGGGSIHSEFELQSRARDGANNAAAAAAASPNGLSITVTNLFTDRDIVLMWEGQDGREVVIGELAATDKMKVNAFVGHKFFARTKETSKRLPDVFIVKEYVTDYSIGYVIPMPDGESAPVLKTRKRGGGVEEAKGSPPLATFLLDNVDAAQDIDIRAFKSTSNSDSRKGKETKNKRKKNKKGNEQEEEEEEEEEYEQQANQSSSFESQSESQSQSVGFSVHPQVEIIGERTASVAAKFKCLVPKGVDYYYDDGKGEGTFQGSLTLGKESTINTYEGHVFFFTEHKKKTREIARLTMTKDKFAYIIKDPRKSAPKDLLKQVEKETKFMDEYYNRTGIMWRHYYGPDGPRGPPTLHMWPTPEIGYTHKVMSKEGFWNCEGSNRKCQSKGIVNMELQVVSQHPKAFIIPKFLSDFEAQEIVKVATPKIYESTVGNTDAGGARKSDTRTSRNAWVGRDSSEVINSIYRRAADLLKIDEKELNSNMNAEEMQVVHYVNGQKYDNHHDWGVSGYPESRYITLLLYLTDVEEGGETAFPKGADGQGFKVRPKKGMAVLFYNLLEDGNADDLALHAALPVISGEKWLANFWVWDPKRRS